MAAGIDFQLVAQRALHHGVDQPDQDLPASQITLDAASPFRSGPGGASSLPCSRSNDPGAFLKTT